MISRLFIIIFVIAGICSCKSHEVVLSNKETTTVKVTQRKVPVFTPELQVNAVGKISVDPKGFPILDNVEVTTNSNKPPNKQPNVSITLDEAGNLNVSVTIPEDTLNVMANDSTTVTEKGTTHIVEVEKKLRWWQQTLMYIGGFIVLIIIVKICLKRKFLS